VKDKEKRRNKEEREREKKRTEGREKKRGRRERRGRQKRKIGPWTRLIAFHMSRSNVHDLQLHIFPL